MAPDGYRSHFITTHDGLKIYVRGYGPGRSDALPVVCLPGLARTSADFDVLARALASHAERPRRVAAIDYRGRGRSDYDPNPGNYNPSVELADVLAVITALELAPAVFVGTSRGGILAMLLAAVRPNAIAGVVLNDIGPVIELAGLMRIKSYVGKLPRVGSFAEGAEILRRLMSSQFPRLTEAEWLAFAERTFMEKDGAFRLAYDAKLTHALDGIDPERPVPQMWNAFDALARVPVMLIRGANSDVLSRETVDAMRVRRPDLEALEAADEGHAPLLADEEIAGRIGAFVARCEAAHPHTPNGTVRKR
jgi:pimeloyl-ACP methyl ester carboxylesterase